VQGTFGVVYALAASQLIMSHMAKEPFEPSLWAISCLAVGAVNSQLRLVDTYWAAIFLAAVSVGGYLHWVTSVIAEVCAFLNIRCLTIKRSS
jgi:ethanolaminephosphotransferase